MADGIISMVLKQLASTAYEYVAGEVKLVLNVTKETEDFAAKLKEIQAVLEDAERRQVKDASVRIWLDKLNDISFQMVDVLDEWNTNMLRQQVEKQEREGEVVVPEEEKKKKKVFGREKEKDVLITKLLSDGGEDQRGLPIIPILGMGRMGKTTLAQLVYNNDKVKAYFEKRVRVCVSDPFDEIKIAKAICSDNAPNLNELDHVLQHMSTSLEGKRFLLVLDDVWTHDHKKWEKLRASLIQSGAHGSRILVTTRQHDVVDMMRARSDMINLGELSEEYCLSIFNHMAFADIEVDESSAFKDISKDIVKKCKGLPLAAKALGGLMYNKKTRREWLDVLNSKIWDREKVEQEVFQPLFLSYYDLAPTIKCCLLYCASFPKDYEYRRDVLINLWMAQDYLNSKGNKDEGEVGQAFFDNLVARSFFQDLEKDSVSGKIIGCKMHDIVHDFVQSLTKNECLILDTEGIDNEIEALGEKVHHLTLIFWTLNLRNSGITEVPEEIGELIHLRHIDLSWNDGLKILPDSICELYNLYTLRLCHCRSFEKLPDNMGKLISLKHMYIGECRKLEYLPKGIRRIKKLKTIDECVVVCGEDEDRAALQVGNMRVLNVEGSLTIKLKGNVKDERELEKAQLWDMKKLFHLEIDSEDRWSECKFLPPLGKLPYLEKLTLLRLDKVEKIGGEFLGIVDLDETSLTSSSSTSFFPKLKQLHINNMYALEEWGVGVEGWNKEDSEISIMPCLSSLLIQYCKGIETLPDFLCKTPLQDFTIRGCPILSERCEQGSGDEWHKISHIPNIRI
ncbi:putative disease resistance protein RGA3 [Pyrus x bretschneideri]|uniref:putative disease resistance protein RGA3 n=1 Tax=Pyrus x bretschneideri TaxID=225117 RepID=UPI00202FBE28|nr:putative disease resistance protein RGA3 [Pyrus x bretschneideri]